MTDPLTDYAVNCGRLIRMMEEYNREAERFIREHNAMESTETAIRHMGEMSDEERDQTRYSTVRRIVAQILYDDQMSWCCELCGNLLTVNGKEAILAAIEGTGNCSECDEIESQVSQWESEQLGQAERAQVSAEENHFIDFD